MARMRLLVAAKALLLIWGHQMLSLLMVALNLLSTSSITNMKIQPQ